MKLIVILALVISKIAIEVSCREVYYEDLTYFPKESNNLIDYGSLKLTRSKDKTLIFLKGNFSILENLTNEKLMILEIYNENALMARSVKPFCEFVRGETIFWPKLVKSSNMPQDNPCPFPAVRFCAISTQCTF